MATSTRTLTLMPTPTPLLNSCNLLAAAISRPHFRKTQLPGTRGVPANLPPIVAGRRIEMMTSCPAVVSLSVKWRNGIGHREHSIFATRQSTSIVASSFSLDSLRSRAERKTGRGEAKSLLINLNLRALRNASALIAGNQLKHLHPMQLFLLLSAPPPALLHSCSLCLATPTASAAWLHQQQKQQQQQLIAIIFQNPFMRFISLSPLPSPLVATLFLPHPPFTHSASCNFPFYFYRNSLCNAPYVCQPLPCHAPPRSAACFWFTPPVAVLFIALQLPLQTKINCWLFSLFLFRFRCSLFVFVFDFHFLRF